MAFSDFKDDLNQIGWNWDNSYLGMPQTLYERALPIKFPQPRVSILNQRLATELGLDLENLSEPAAAALFAGQAIPSGAKPIAQAYAGHQFGGFSILGDGRAILLGEHLTHDGKRFDIQFKGSGQTPYSRRGDGKAVLGPMLREYIISEAMNALRIPTTRSLAVVTTGESVFRERLLPGAVLTRVAASHIRVGTFQLPAARGQYDALKILADYTIDRHFPDARQAVNPYLEFLRQVFRRQASLIARWQGVGFIHGVMNTDNMAISGETIDYGPCAFMDVYHPETVFSSIDDNGRYAYRNQPVIAQWNLARFAETLIKLIDPDQKKAIDLATEGLHQFASDYHRAWLAVMRTKLGLISEEAADHELIGALLEWMEENEADFTNTFRALCRGADSIDQVLAAAGRQSASVKSNFLEWHATWMERLKRNGMSQEESLALMKSVNPAFIPRNHRVEDALKAANEGDLSVLKNLLNVLSHPFDEQPDSIEYRMPPAERQMTYRTFCGT